MRSADTTGKLSATASFKSTQGNERRISTKKLYGQSAQRRMAPLIRGRNRPNNLTPTRVIRLLNTVIMNAETSNIPSNEVACEFTDSQKLLLQIARQVLLIQEQQNQIETQSREILKLKFTRNIRKMTDAELSEFGDAVVALHLLLENGKISEYDPIAYRTGFTGGKGACERYIKQIIEPALENIGLAHWAYEPRVYKDIMPKFFHSYHVSMTRNKVA